MAWTKDNGSGSGAAAARYVDGKKPLIEQAITDAGAAKPLAESAKVDSGQAKVTAGQADVKATDALGKATAAKTTAEAVRGEFDRVVAEAGSSNPEVVNARGNFVNLRQRLDDTTTQLADMPSQISTFDGTKEVKFIAHRGLSAIAPENSIPAYEWAARCGAWGAETDVLTTSDGIWVLMHDATVDRTTDGTGSVSSMTLAQIKELKIDGGNNVTKYPNLRVPTMEEYLLTCKKINLVPVIEIKAANNASDYVSFVELVKKYGYEDNSIVISFDKIALQEVRKHSERIMMQYLGSLTQVDINFVKNLKNAGLDVEQAGVTKANVELAHKEGLTVNTWTVNNPDTAKKLIGYGVDYITSDILVGVK